MAGVSTSTVTGRQEERELEAMFREHYRLVYQTARSLVGNAADAEDVLQTVFLRLARNEVPPRFRSNVKGYFYRAAVNQSLDLIRSRQRYELVDDPERFEAADDSTESARAEETHRRLAEALADLNPAAAHIVVLRYVHNYSDAEIAKLLGTSRTAIAVRLFRSRARLKKLLHDLGEK